MTTLRQVELESLFLILAVAGVSLFFVVQRNNQGVFNAGSAQISLINSPLATEAAEQDIFSQISPDGTREVIMKVDKNNDDTRTYSFYTADGSGDNEQFIFDKTLGATGSMTIPFNTFSSDDKYFFVVEKSASGKSVFAFKADGEPFSIDEKYFDVTYLFKKQNTENNFYEATGWASESLIIINTTKEDGKKGPSYWFEVPSKSIILLSTEF